MLNLARRARAGSCVALVLVLAIGAPESMAQVLLNEYLASNIRGDVDEFGNHSDWVELHNSGPAAIDLAGYSITDDPAVPNKWVFPTIWLGPSGRQILYLDDRDLRDVPAWWETVIDQGSEAAYRANSSAPPAGWEQPGFDASAWDHGPTGIGYGDGDDATVVAPTPSICVVLAFEVADPGAIEQIFLHLDADDGFLVWLNGRLVLTENLPAGEIAWDQPASTETEARIYRGGVPPGYALPARYVVAGRNVLAIEVHTAEVPFDDLSCIPFVTLGLSAPPAGAVGAADLLQSTLPHPHANFALSADGETLVLSDPAGTVVDAVDTGIMPADVSRGRYPDGAPTWHYFTAPTPHRANADDGAVAFASEPVFSLPGGLYDGGVQVTIASPDEGAVVRYTLDGSVPGLAAPILDAPLDLLETTVVRAAAYVDGRLPSPVTSRTFIIDDTSVLPTVSFIADPFDLWDPNEGMMVEPNLFAEIEVPMHVELFGADGDLLLDQDAGACLFGTSSRYRPQKSLRLIARGAYGDGDFDGRLFASMTRDSFVNLVWRNAGDDWCTAHFRDAFMHELATPLDIERLAYRPSRVFLNGAYWGILNLRERLDADLLEAAGGPGDGEVDLIKNSEVVEGDDGHYLSMIDYLSAHDITEPAHYAYLQSQMETDNFATYVILEVFAANTDWVNNNVAFWRPRTPGGRWRWALYDLDASLGFHTTYEHASLTRALDPAGGGWPGTPEDTYLLRRLMENPSFRARFVNIYCDLLNSVLLPTHTRSLVEDIAGVIAPEMPRHLARWNQGNGWSASVQQVRDFLDGRPAYCRQELRDRLGLGADLTLQIEVSPPAAGRVRLAAVAVDSSFSGTYFQGVPIALTAEAADGFRFAGWSEPDLGGEPNAVISPTGDHALTARFEPIGLTSAAVINEINYNAAAAFDPGDWIELHNPGTGPRDLAGWTFKDEDDSHVFTLPAGTTIPAHGYLVLCQNLGQFLNLFPHVTNAIGSFGFGFSGSGEALRLFDPDGNLHDQVDYDDTYPWPSEPDGHGPTLELRDPASDNDDGANWRASTNHGTPGAPNSAATPAAAPAAQGPSLGACRPNPFNPQAQITFTLDSPGLVELTVHDLRGARVRTLLAEMRAAGAHTATWNGRDDDGRPLPSGTYLVQFRGGDSTLRRKIMLLR